MIFIQGNFFHWFIYTVGLLHVQMHSKLKRQYLQKPEKRSIQYREATKGSAIFLFSPENLKNVAMTQKRLS